jgi:tetratricopeptide (TPR) repeat protein
LTARERVLLHLFSYQRYSQDADAPKAVTQDGIADAVEIGRNNVAKILSEMDIERRVDILSKHVKGLPSVRRVYFLSKKGFDEAKHLKEDLEAMKVEVIDLKGEVHIDEVGRLSVYMPGSYTFLEIIMGVARGKFDCRSFHESKTKEERRFVDFTDKKPAVRSFFGRDKEYRQLLDLITIENTRAIIIYGIPGIGKTTLLAKFAQDVRGQTNVFWLKIHEWVNVRGLLRPLAEFLSQLGKKNLEWYLNQNETPHTGEVLQILITDMGDIPILLIFDDVHKGERLVLEFLSALMSIMEELPRIRVVCATREVPAFYSRSLVIRNMIKEVQMEGLDRESSLKMLRARSMPEDTMEQVIQITKGHPLFLELIEDPQSALGKNIRMFIDQEVVSKLDIAEKRIMNVASVFRYPVIMDAFFITEEEIRKDLNGKEFELQDIDYTVSYETVDSLISKSILHESIGRMIGMHDLLREFTYSRLTPRQRMIYHRAASKFYIHDSSHSSKVEALYHCIMAKDLEKAVEIAAGNGQEIISKGYAMQFDPLLSRLLVETKGQDNRDRMELLMLHAQILELHGDYERASEELVEMLSELPQEKDTRLKAEVHRRLGVLELKRNLYDNSADNLNKASRIANDIRDAQTLADIYYDMGGLLERRGRFDEAVQNFEAAGDFARGIGDKIALGRSLYGLGRVKASLLEFTEAVRLKKEALNILERTGDVNMTSKVCIGIGNDMRAIKQGDEGLKYLERAVDLATSVGDINTLAYALSNEAAEYLARSNLPKAEELLHEATKLFIKLNDQLMISTMHFYRGFLYNMRGDWEWAKEEFRLSLEILRGFDLPSRLAHWLLEVATVYTENNEKDEAMKMYEEAYAIANRIGHERIMRDAKDSIAKILA